MERNVFIFHGTEGYPEENWFPWLKKELEKNGHNVIVPQFPSPPIIPAKIGDWFDVLEQFEDKINQDSVLIGHSLGGLFALRVLEKIKSKVHMTALISAPVGIKPILNHDRDSAFCGFDLDWKKIQAASEKFIVFQSDDDPYVSLGNGKKIAKELGVELSFIPNAGHFNSSAGYSKFPALLETLVNQQI